MEKTENIKKILNTGLGVVALLGVIACGCPGGGSNPTASVPATNIKIDTNETISVLTNSHGTLTAVVHPENHTEGDVEWSSDNTNAVTISKTGPLTANYIAGSIVGRATITARVGEEMDTMTMLMEEEMIAAESIEIDQGETLTTNVTGSGTLTATVTPSSHTDGSVVWSSDNTNVVTVNSISDISATFTAGSVGGSATITARVGDETDTIIIQVNSPATNIEIVGSEIRSTVINSRGTLTAVVSPGNHTDGKVVWTSSSDDIVSVSSDDANTATFTARAVGSATITARVGDETDTITVLVEEEMIAATNIEIDQGASLTTNVRGSGTLTATVTPSDHTEGDVEWISDNINVVTVNSTSDISATFTAGSVAGRAIITARVGDETDTITIYVNSPATNIEIDQGEALSNKLGGVRPLTATVLPPGHSDGDVEWSSDNESFVTVTKTGYNSAFYTAVAIGMATITARVGDNNIMDTITIYVNLPATNIEIDQGDTLTTNVRGSGTLTATVTPSGHTDGRVVWSSDNTNVVTVNSISDISATFTAGSVAGRAIITARVGDETDTITIYVNSPATNIEIDQGDTLTTNVRGSGTLTATVTPSDHTDGSVVWSSDNTNVVTVNSISDISATFTAGSVGGSATITARVGDETDTITVYVNLPATNIEIDQGDTLTTNLTGSGTLTATVTPEGHTDGKVVWTSSSPGIVSVSEAGPTSATFTAGSVGSAIITAQVGGETDTITIYIAYIDDSTKVDDDGDGLIEILDLTMLHRMRYNLAGTSYKTNSGDSGDSNGCPSSGCEGYELVSNLSFDADGDGMTWSGNAADGYTLDSDDDNGVYFDVSDGGWEPIGDLNNPFTAIFDGGGFTITGLAISRREFYTGMFGFISDNAQIRGLGLVNNLAYFNVNSGGGNVGGLVGDSRGSITACYTTGNAIGDGHRQNIGGLVGSQSFNGSITACYATGNVDGGNGGNNQSLGGLVGQSRSSITACYATGNVDGRDRIDDVGGLVGTISGGSITASYATGAVDGGEGDGDDVGGLVGDSSSGSITASYGFGSVVGENTNSGTDGNPPVANAMLLTLSNAGTNADGDFIWNDADSDTMGAWQFGSGAPKLFYNDYDGSGSTYGCSGTPTILIPNCGSVIPGQP